MPPTHAELARKLLLYKMREYSQDGFCASWLHGLEEELWALSGSPPPIPTSGFPPEFFHSLRQLASIADGWWVWETAPSPEKSGAVFVSLQEWERRHQAI